MESGMASSLSTATTAATAHAASSPSVSLSFGGCSTTILPASGVVSIVNNPPVTLSYEAIFMYNCPTATPSATPDVIDVTPLMMANSGIILDETTAGPGYSDLRDPFYMTTFPIFYVLAATTVVAYMLVIMLFITPRSFVNGGVVYLGRRKGFTTGSTGVAFGERPWFQKVAAMTVAISLTIASGTSFATAKDQYSFGIVQNAQRLQRDVMEGTPLKVIRLISDTVLWLAQAQTLLHLFSRERQQMIIKWAAFALITLELLFSSLNSFLYPDNGSQGNMRPRSFVDAIPALSYLFQLTMGLLYAAWVIYYAIGKKRYAFYHPLMKNMWLVAMIALIAVLVPIVFFIIDIANPQLAGWGDYVRWVGAAAASVMVWEWAERIETLESEEKKDGILGRQVFDDGDEMADATSGSTWRERKARGGGGPFSFSLENQSQRNAQSRQNVTEPGSGGQQSILGDLIQPPLWPLRPPPTVTPVSRTDTGSISTVYVMRQHHPQQPSDSSGRTPDPQSQGISSRSRSSSSARSHGLIGGEDADAHAARAAGRGPETFPPQTSSLPMDVEANDSTARSRNRWRALAQFASPLSLLRGESQESRAGTPSQPASASASASDEKSHRDDVGRWDFRSKLQHFAVSQAEKIQSKINPQPDTNKFPVTVVPPPPTRGATLEQVEEERLSEDGGPRQGSTSAESRDARQVGQYSASTRRSTSRPSSQSQHSGTGTVTANTNFVAPPMWPGVEPRYSTSSYAESSRGASLDPTPSRESRQPG